jgi:uncharacterized protein (DUF2062 family)
MAEAMFEGLTAWTRRNMPTREQMAANRFIPHWVLHSHLWRFNRRTVPRGVALGLLVGILVPVAQIIFAAVFSFAVRANVPVAAVVTFVTNPFTTPLIWAASYKVGATLMHFDGTLHAAPIDRLFTVTDFWSFLEWLTDEGKVLALGLFVVAVVSAAIGYLATSLGWRLWIARKRSRSQRAHAVDEA